MDLYGFLASWLEKLIGARAHQKATDLRIADKAHLLRRQLLASFEDWPKGPQTLEELVRWALKISRNFDVTEPALGEIVELRAEASAARRRAVGIARNEYCAMADLINPLIPDVINPVIKTPWLAEGVAVAEGPTRRAFAHLRRCIAAL